MRIVVLGCGGVGGFLAARLTDAGHEVTIIARGETLKALNESGLILTSSRGNVRVSRVNATSCADGISFVDLVLVCVKLWDTLEALRTIQGVVGPETAVVSFQNGVHAADEIAHCFSKRNAVGGVCYISARIKAPGQILHNGTLQRFLLGEFKGTSTNRSQSIAQCFQGAGIDCELSSDIRLEIWKKFVFLVSLSAVTSSIRAPLGLIREQPEARGLLLGLVQEVVEIARMNGVLMEEAFANQLLAFMDSLPAETTSSMYTDLLLGRRLELPWLSADVVKMGRELNVATPLNAAVSAILSIYSLGVSAAQPRGEGV